MGYRIQYAAASAEKYTTKRSVRTRKWVYFTVAIILITGIFFARKPLRSFLFPGDPEITDVAVEQMIEALEEGEGAYKAAQVFCREIINGAG